MNPVYNSGTINEEISAGITPKPSVSEDNVIMFIMCVQYNSNISQQQTGAGPGTLIEGRRPLQRKLGSIPQPS